MKIVKIFIIIILAFLMSWFLVTLNAESKVGISLINSDIKETSRIVKIENPFEKLNYKNEQKEFLVKLVEASNDSLNSSVIYDPTYFGIDYPNGDVPKNKGVCTDVVIRSFRGVGIDLQKLVHQDMKNNFSLYPKKWGLTKPDTNIDHRRVPNLIIFFTRHGETLPIIKNPNDYYPGDVVTWSFKDGKTHIGMVVNYMNPKNGNPLIVHNIGRGPQMHDVLFEWKITGHFRYFAEK